MTDLLPALTERLRKIRMRCADCGALSNTEKECPEAPAHTWETDDVAIARAALAFVAEQNRVDAKVLDAIRVRTCSGNCNHDLVCSQLVAERLPTREEIVKALSVEYGRLPDGSAYPSVERMADAFLRDLRERLGVKP